VEDDDRDPPLGGGVVLAATGQYGTAGRAGGKSREMMMKRSKSDAFYL